MPNRSPGYGAAKGISVSTPSLPLKEKRRPPAFSHPLIEVDKKRQKAPECHFKIVPFTEGVPEGRGRLFCEAPEQLPLHRRLYNARLQPNANELRKRMTKAEACLWKYVLRAKQMNGYTFNRQRPVLRYIADFMCKPLRLIIEVDGSSHDCSKVQKHDAFRQRELEECGFTILRFTNDEVLHEIEQVRGAIARKVKEIESSDILAVGGFARE
jgi:very-short-patch-repair endonuclease